jgi:hypothetical protein
MAATIAYAYGGDSTRVKETHRLGSQFAKAEANTWRTFTTCVVDRDGSGYVSVMRDGGLILRFEFGPES